MQPPPSYPQQPQGQGYPQGPQQGPPPQYAMQQQPYYPQQKKGMPGWAWVLIICGVVFILCPIGGIFALAAIPLITSNTRDARRAEGEQLMMSARDATRVEYSKQGVSPGRISQFTQLYLFEGQYYKVDDPIDSTSSGGTITCSPTASSDSKGRIEFEWASGDSTTHWNSWD